MMCDREQMFEADKQQLLQAYNKCVLMNKKIVNFGKFFVKNVPNVYIL